ncbi:hypothetical protein SADUNF_Sadunf15G0034000 [Salix dunnii]|uniref:Golgin candidate 2 n=1 Tax=Salix dunnii TaxID=1413687 RepID=A0A835JDA1_9ROSI|nr:hypothetical protein SADUNF_Sadunf15G0034000 [Salix dunnii]
MMIDHQAAESLKKNEQARSDDDQKFDLPAKAGGSLSLKDQLKKKTNEFNNDYKGKLNADFGINKNTNNVVGSVNDKEVLNVLKISPKPRATLTDSDWTELLGTPPSQNASSPNRSNGAPAIRGLRKEGRKQGSLGLNSLAVEAKRNQKVRGNSDTNNSGVISKRLDLKLNGKPSDGEESSSSARSSSVELPSDGKVMHGTGLEQNKNVGVEVVGERKDEGSEENGGRVENKDVVEGEVLHVGNKNRASLSVPEKIDGISDVKKGVGDVYGRLKNTVKGKHGTRAASRSSVSDDLKKNYSTSESSSDSDSDSGSSSDSESEQERERRKRILAERAAAKAVQAIKERENIVARLEGEKQSLEKILEERAKQQVQEASELQTTTMETMEAVDLEKQKHNNTRMEVLARLAKLETTNADLARSLATAQKNLELEINQVAELRQQFELKEVALEGELHSLFDHIGSQIKVKEDPTVLASTSKGVQFEREILETEHLFLIDKVQRLEDKAKKLEADIEMTIKEMEDPTEVEIELKRRLGQLTDHLIQKQAQVEALSSEKATIAFRIEAVSRLLEENKSVMNSSNLESGTWAISDSKLRPMFEDKIRAGRKHLGSLVQQLDAIFLAGVVFLRRNPTAKLWCVVYLLCLHVWVIYILMAPSQSSNEGRSGAVFSLENFNKTAGV